MKTPSCHHSMHAIFPIFIRRMPLSLCPLHWSFHAWRKRRAESWLVRFLAFILFRLPDSNCQYVQILIVWLLYEICMPCHVRRWHCRIERPLRMVVRSVIVVIEHCDLTLLRLQYAQLEHWKSPLLWVVRTYSKHSYSRLLAPPLLVCRTLQEEKRRIEGVQTRQLLNPFFCAFMCLPASL